MAVWSEINTSELSKDLRIDPEYFQPCDIDYLRSLIKKKSKEIHDICDVTTGRTPGAYYEDGDTIVVRSGDLIETLIYPDNGHPFLRTNRVNQNLVDLRNGDVLISSIGFGSIGKISIVVDSKDFATVSEVIILRNSLISNEYLFAYLRTQPGQRQIEREVTGATGQQHLLKTKVEKIIIPLPSDELRENVKKIVRKSYDIAIHARKLYKEAENLLLKDLGLEHLSFPSPLFYERKYSESQEAVRVDAEYFQPKYYRMIEAIQATGEVTRLGDMVSHCERGFQPEYVEDGEVAVINTKHLGRQFLCGEYEHCTLDVWNRQKRAQLRKWDVLFYSTGAYIGRTNCLLEDIRAIGSNHVTIIRPKEECNPVYLALFMNSAAGLMQADRFGHGSAQREVYPDDIKNFTLWLPDIKRQEEFAEMVVQAHAKREESKQLLDEAKRLVEEAIKR